MKKISFAFCIASILALSGCSIFDFEFSTSQDNTECLKENPSHSCKQNQ